MDAVSRLYETISLPDKNTLLHSLDRDAKVRKSYLQSSKENLFKVRNNALVTVIALTKLKLDEDCGEKEANGGRCGGFVDSEEDGKEML